METKYVLRIETDKYAGNFERDMWAYITGLVGDCGTGSKMAEIFKNDSVDEYIVEWFEDEIIFIQDEHGAYSPVQMYGPPNYKSIEVQFSSLPSKEILDVIYNRACNFCNRYIVPDKFDNFPTKIIRMDLIREDIIKTYTNVYTRFNNEI